MDTDRLPDVIKRVLAWRRRSRASFVVSRLKERKGLRVIDVGCGIDGRSFEDFIPLDWRVTGVDLVPEERIRHSHPGFTYVRQDAANLGRFKDEEFDLAVSIGMLEHVTEDESFRRVVAEIRRVARQHVVIVPYRYAWLEPHYGVPFFPILPSTVRVALVRALNLSNEGAAVTRDPGFIDRHTRWLSNAQYREVFPDSEIHLLPTLELIAITRVDG